MPLATIRPFLSAGCCGRRCRGRSPRAPGRRGPCPPGVPRRADRHVVVRREVERRRARAVVVGERSVRVEAPDVNLHGWLLAVLAHHRPAGWSATGGHGTAAAGAGTGWLRIPTVPDGRHISRALIPRRHLATMPAMRATSPRRPRRVAPALFARARVLSAGSLLPSRVRPAVPAEGARPRPRPGVFEPGPLTHHRCVRRDVGQVTSSRRPRAHRRDGNPAPPGQPVPAQGGRRGLRGQRLRKLAGSTQVRELGTIETPIVLTNTLAVGPPWKASWRGRCPPGNEAVRSVNRWSARPTMAP